MQLEAVRTLSWIGKHLATPFMLGDAVAVFDDLAPGEHLTVLLDAPPTLLREHFLAERPGRFEWTPVPAGPRAFAVQIFRRAKLAGGKRQVNEALSWDHDRLDSIEAAAFEARRDNQFADAAALFQVFSFGLRRHIRFEEEILFPEFESRSGFPSEMGPTAVMRLEHREILETVTALESAIGLADGEADRLRRALHEVLGPHNAKEEAVVYPGTDRALNPDELDALVARIQATA